MGARMMSGNTNNHELLEKKLAEFEGKEDTILLNYGYQGMVSLIDVLCSRHDVLVFGPRDRLAVGARRPFRHPEFLFVETAGAYSEPHDPAAGERDRLAVDPPARR